MAELEIDVGELYENTDQAKLSDYEKYKKRCLDKVTGSSEVVLTGAGPIWLYLKLAHTLHGKVKSLYYSSPVTGRVEIFNHNPF